MVYYQWRRGPRAEHIHPLCSNECNHPEACLRGRLLARGYRNLSTRCPYRHGRLRGFPRSDRGFRRASSMAHTAADHSLSPHKVAYRYTADTAVDDTWAGISQVPRSIPPDSRLLDDLAAYLTQTQKRSRNLRVTRTTQDHQLMPGALAPHASYPIG